MRTSPVSSLIGHIRRAVPSDGDGELLGRFVERRDETALAALVERHGPMVWGVCRRLLGHHDAEDAFQATFIVLVRKAATVKPREMVGNWLHGVARQAALQAQSAARRRARERQVPQMPDTEAPQDRWADMRPILDEELSRLPDHYRAIIVLCDLEGRTRKEVARHLGCAEGTVASRLARAREMLARRLAARGCALSGGAAVLSQNMASAAVPASVVSSTIKAASLCAAGHAATPVEVAALAEGVLKAMLVSKLKAAVAVVLVLGLLAAGATALTYRIASAQGDKKPAARKPPEPVAKPQKEEVPPVENTESAGPRDMTDLWPSDLLAEVMKASTAWGKEADGLQMGLALLPEDAHTVRIGGKARFAVKLRNVGKADVKVTYVRPQDEPPAVTDAGGGRVTVVMPPRPRYNAAVSERIIKPREVIILYGPEIAIAPEDPKTDGEVRVGTPTIFAKPGKYKIVYGGMLTSHPKLTTGTVEFEVKPAVPADKQQDTKSAYTTADIVVQYRDEAGREVRHLQQFRVDDAETVAKLASHFPGILGERGSGPRTSAGKRATFTIKFYHKSGEASQARVAHVTSDYATWWWRDNTPYTGDRKVEEKDQLQGLMERLAAKHKVDLK